MKKILYREVRIFFTALMFYTRIPCPTFTDHKEEYLNRATRYFPLIGAVVAGISFAVFYVSQFFFSIPVSILLSMIISILTTGAFHEDGFADTCDGFGGGWTKEKILTIMKDSRVGTYGVVGVVLLLALKFIVLLDISRLVSIYHFGLIFLSAHVLSRFSAILIIRFLPYSREDATSKVKPVAKGVELFDFCTALFFTLIPLALLAGIHLLLVIAVVPLLLITWYLGNYFNKWIQGYTGDCLGATQQVTEVIFYLTILALWKFI